MKIWLDYIERRSMSYSEQVAALEDIARESDVSIDPSPIGLAVSTRIYLLPAKRWQRVSSSAFSYSEALGRNRLVNAVCWHGHYRFLSELFKRFPNARVKSALSDWRSAADFAMRAEESGYTNVGSQFMPMQAREACLCVDNGDYISSSYDMLEGIRSPATGERYVMDYTRMQEVTYNGLVLGHVPVKVLCPECGEDVWDLPSGSKLAKCWNTEGHVNGGTLAFDTMSDGE